MVAGRGAALGGALIVDVASPRYLLTMKLFAARVRTRDYDDLVALWPECGFDSAEERLSSTGTLTHPHEAQDPYLVEYVRGLVD